MERTTRLDRRFHISRLRRPLGPGFRTATGARALLPPPCSLAVIDAKAQIVVDSVHDR